MNLEKKLSKIEIVERSSGFWLVEETGVVDGPFETIEEAQNELDQIQMWKEVDYNLGLGKERHGEV